jgi:predicted PurR-regulated permease PerM
MPTPRRSSKQRPPEATLWIQRGMALTAGALLILAVVWFALQAGSILVLVFLAVLLGAGLEPVVGWLRAHFAVGRTAGILLAYGAFLASIVVIAFLVVPTALNQLGLLARELPSILDQARSWAHELRPAVLASTITALLDAAQRNLGQIAPNPDDVVQAGLTVAEAVVALVTLLTLVFFWLTEHARLQRYALAFVPEDRRAGTREAWNEVEARLGLWVRGQLTIMGSVALLTGVVYTALGLPSPLLLAIVAGIAEAIPLAGPTLGAIPAILVASTVSPELAVVVVVAYVVIQFIEGNVLVPMIMKNTIGLSPFLVLVSILVGAAVGGIVGALLAVPVAAAAEVILERLQARRLPVTQTAAEDETGEKERDRLGEKPLDLPASNT